MRQAAPLRSVQEVLALGLRSKVMTSSAFCPHTSWLRTHEHAGGHKAVESIVPLVLVTEEEPTAVNPAVASHGNLVKYGQRNEIMKEAQETTFSMFAPALQLLPSGKVLHRGSVRCS